MIHGQAIVTLDSNDIHVEAGNSIDIPKGSLHRIMNVGRENLAFVEVQTGDYFGEDDIERVEDDYGRVP
jgi:mannose-6-phosphate isomerase-like protein (cupin superfamily)